MKIFNALFLIIAMVVMVGVGGCESHGREDMSLMIHEKGPEVHPLSQGTEFVTVAPAKPLAGMNGVGYVTFEKNHRFVYALVAPMRDIPAGMIIRVSQIAMHGGQDWQQDPQYFYIVR